MIRPLPRSLARSTRSRDINSAVDNIQTSRLNGFDLYSGGGTGRGGRGALLSDSRDLCFRYHSAGDGQTNTSIVAVDNAAEESLFSSFVRRREITQTSRAFLVLSRRLGRIQRSVLSSARSRSLVLPTATTERGQFLDLLYAPRNAGGEGAMGRANTRTGGHEQSGQLITAERRKEGE